MRDRLCAAVSRRRLAEHVVREVRSYVDLHAGLPSFHVSAGVNAGFQDGCARDGIEPALLGARASPPGSTVAWRRDLRQRRRRLP